MSVLTVSGRRFAAGLYWMERGGAASVARNARAFGRPWYVHWGGQTGYAADEEDAAGCPSLAASLQAHIGAPFWMALVEADDGRLALVKARDGAILADGDEVFAERAPALAAFERSRDVGWALHATPGLADGEVAAIDPAALPEEPATHLVAAPLARLGLRTAASVLAVAAVMAASVVLWVERESLWRLIADPEPEAEAEQAPADPPVTVALDAGALIASCRRALMEHPPWLPAWRTERVACEGRLSDRGTPWYAALTAARPELEDRAVLVVRWRLGSGRPEPFHRRIAEAHLSGWYAASVTGERAWAVVPLAPVLVLTEAVPPSLLEFRAAVDRRFGARASRIEYQPQGTDGVEVRISTRRPPARLAGAVAAVPGLELVRLAQGAGGEWTLEGRRVAPASIPVSEFERLARPVSQPSARPASQPAARPLTGSPDHG